MKNKNSHLVLGAVSLLAANSPVGAHTTSTTHDSKIEALNTASFQSMESTWLKVPRACKARGFHANPSELINKEASQPAQTIYASYKA